MWWNKKKKEKEKVEELEISVHHKKLELEVLIEAMGFYLEPGTSYRDYDWKEIVKYAQDLRGYKNAFLKINKICERENVPSHMIKVYDPDNMIERGILKPRG